MVRRSLTAFLVVLLATPAYLHWATGGATTRPLTIEPMEVEGRDGAGALESANAPGGNDRIRPFALNGIHTHRR